MPKYYYLSLSSRFVFWRLKVVCAVFDPSPFLPLIVFHHFFMLSSSFFCFDSEMIFLLGYLLFNITYLCSL